MAQIAKPIVPPGAAESTFLADAVAEQRLAYTARRAPAPNARATGVTYVVAEAGT
ncbi:MAG: hypothetical protein JJ864_02910 [Rhizobiaceae bacterium]|nr:hypothetical protein [Rhizobiaceae bacterium]